MKLAFFTLAILFLVKYASSEELPVEKDKPQESKHKADHNSKEVSGNYDYDLEDYNYNVKESIEESNGTKSHETTDKDNKSYEYMSGSFRFLFFRQSDHKRKNQLSCLFIFCKKILILHENDS